MLEIFYIIIINVLKIEHIDNNFILLILVNINKLFLPEYFFFEYFDFFYFI